MSMHGDHLWWPFRFALKPGDQALSPLLYTRYVNGSWVCHVQRDPLLPKKLYWDFVMILGVAYEKKSPFWLLLQPQNNSPWESRDELSTYPCSHSFTHSPWILEASHSFQVPLPDIHGNEQTRTILTLCFASSINRIIQQELWIFVFDNSLLRGSLTVPDNKLKLGPVGLHLFTSSDIPTTYPPAWKQAAPRIITHSTYSEGSIQATSLGSSLGKCSVLFLCRLHAAEVKSEVC